MRRTDPSGYDWDNGAGVYRDSGGKAVPLARVHEALGTAMESAAERMGEASGQLQAGKITVTEWERIMAREANTLHTSATALANGGWAQTPPSAWARCRETIKFQLGKLSGFAGELANGTQPMDGRYMLRASMYAGAGHGTFENERRAERVEAGAKWERWIIDPGAESCEGCLECADLGWVPIGTLPDIGSNECLTNCRCFVDYSDSDEMPEN